MLPNDSQNTRCGFIAIVGRPNVGKSSLMNHLIKHKISITSRKPQTTQRKIYGIVTADNTQYIFVDTPGFQTQYINALNKRMNQAVINVLSDVDVILYIVEAGIFNPGDEAVLALLPPTAHVILIINKKDKIKDKMLLDKYMQQLTPKFNFKHTLFVSAKHHLNVDAIYPELQLYLPVGPFLYTVDQITDKDQRFLCSEIIREKLFRHLGQELPYNVAVIIDEYNITNLALTRISATILVDKFNQKGIVIGKGGEKLKLISSEARIDMEVLLKNKVFLQVWIKVKNGFANDIKFLQQFEN